jgi:hypothetical protein
MVFKLQKNMIRVVHPGSRIRMLTFSHPGSRIPDPGVKKHPIPDPGSRIRIRNTGKNVKKILIRIIIFGDIHTFTSLGVFGEYAKSLSASSPLTHKSFPRILRICLNTFRAYGDDFYIANNPDLS